MVERKWNEVNKKIKKEKYGIVHTGKNIELCDNIDDARKSAKKHFDWIGKEDGKGYRVVKVVEEFLWEKEVVPEKGDELKKYAVFKTDVRFEKRGGDFCYGVGFVGVIEGYDTQDAKERIENVDGFGDYKTYILNDEGKINSVRHIRNFIQAWDGRILEDITDEQNNRIPIKEIVEKKVDKKIIEKLESKYDLEKPKLKDILPIEEM